MVSLAGLHQEDPLSPYLFILCQDLLIVLLIHNLENKTISMLKPISVCSPIPLLSLADDCIIFCKASNSSINTLTVLCCIYTKASGPEVCWSKSKVHFSPNIPIYRKQELIAKSGVEPNKCKDKYLGLLFLFRKRKAKFFYDLIQKTSFNINAWYNKFLYAVGRTVLI